MNNFFFQYSAFIHTSVVCNKTKPESAVVRKKKYRWTAWRLSSNLRVFLGATAVQMIIITIKCKWGTLNQIYVKYKPVEINFVCLLEFAYCKVLEMPLQHSSVLPSTGAALVTTTSLIQWALQCGISFICFLCGFFWCFFFFYP